MLCRSRLFASATLFVGIAGAALAGDDFLLARNRVGGLVVGMPESAIYKVYPRRITRKVDLQLEGMPTPAVQIFLVKNHRKPSLVVRLTGAGSTIDGIDVTDPRFKTATGVGVGASLGQLRHAQKLLSFVSGEGVNGANAEDLGITFDLMIDRRIEARLFDSRKPDQDVLSIIPDDTRIKSVWVYWTPNAPESR
jgi:hypothetical protein